MVNTIHWAKKGRRHKGAPEPREIDKKLDRVHAERMQARRYPKKITLARVNLPELPDEHY